MRIRMAFAAGFSLFAVAHIAGADTLEVGPGKTYSKPSDAIKAANPGDTIEIDAAGSYDGDTVTWSKDNLTVRGVNGRAKIHTTAPDGEKGIFTITAPNATVENIEFSGAAIPAGDGGNGAGIRHQGVNLTVRGCYFHDNQDGILGAPSDDGGATTHDGIGTVLIETSEFANNGAGDGQTHNMYLNHYASFTLRYSYTHGAVVGHLVKSRAYKSFILFNRITDESGTTASYEIDLPNGGTSYVIGNLIEQSAETGNPAMINTGEEGASNPTNQIFVVNNTFVNDKGSGTFVSAVGVTATLINDIFKGGGTITNAASPTLSNNFDDSSGDPLLVGASTYDYHLASGSPCVDKGKDPGAGPDMPLGPIAEYVHPTSAEGRTIAGAAIDIGAYELGGAVPLGDGGVDTLDAGGGGGGLDGGIPPSEGNDILEPSSSDSGGCGCAIVGADVESSGAWAIALGAIAMSWRRRRAAKSSK